MADPWLGLRQAIAVGLLVAAAGASLLVPRITVDNRLERWLVTDPVLARDYARFCATFGSDEFVLVALDGRPLLEEGGLAAMVAASERLEQVPGVRRVQGIPVVYRDLFGGEDPDALAEELTSTPFYRGLFVSAALDMAGLLVEVEPPEGPAGRRALVDGVKQAVEPLEAHGFRVAMVGSTVLIDSLDRTSAREAGRTFPVALGCSLLVLALSLRSLRAMVVAAVCSGVTLTLTLGLAVVCGRSLDMLTSALPALLWVLSLGNVVHLLKRFASHRRTLQARPALARAVGEVTRPSVLASVTTAVGFLSLAVAGVVPVRELGVLAATGILVGLVCTLTLGPALVLWLRVPAQAATRPESVHSPAGDRLTLRRARAIVAAAGAVLALSMASAWLIRVQSNPLSFLPGGHPTSRAYAEVGRRLTGFYTMEVVVETPAPWWEPAVSRQLAALETDVAASPLVARVVSPLDVLRKLNHWQHGFDPAAYRLPDTTDVATALLGQLDDRAREQLASLAAPSGHTVRLSAVVREMDEHLFLGLVEKTRTALASLPTGWEGLVTGQVLQLVSAQQQLVVTQLETLALAFVLVFATIGVGLRSWRLMLVSILPNVLPCAAAFLVMAAADLALDPATVMTASIALGIAVDNTVHQLEVYRAHLVAGLARNEAVVLTRTEVAPAMATTGLTACAGFFALVLSAFLPIRDFGLLSGVAVLVALAADLFVVPAELVAFRREVA